jgi:hypothetical protein
MKQLDFESYERDQLLVLLKDVIEKLEKKKMQLNITRDRLRLVRNRFIKTKAIVKYQSERIIQLHESRKM